MSQSISRLAVANGLRKRGDVRACEQITIDIGIIDFEARLLLIANRVVSLRAGLLRPSIAGKHPMAASLLD